MILTRYNLSKINNPQVIKPDEDIFDLPEKVLQFGTGVLLRALPDYYIDKANRQSIFNGRVVIVKSTDNGDTVDFDRQDGLYTLHIKGIENGSKVDEQIINSSVSRVLSASKDWETILKVAHNPNLQVIISNTTEVGIELVQDDISKHPPVSFPGKLLALLYERYKAFSASNKSGLVIVPTELIVDNGKKLESIILELAHLNKLEPAFMDWLESCNHFCNSLVDRIVPGKPQPHQQNLLKGASGYDDNLRIVTEPYCLWAIEGDDDIRSVLSFSQADSGVVVTPNIGMYRELKLRLLNGTHTLSCAIAFLSGFATVNEAMDNTAFLKFVEQLMLKEIAPAIPYAIDDAVKSNFANSVLDRFRNGSIGHQWLSIAAQYSSKIKLRVLPLLFKHYENNSSAPECFAFGFAAFIRFMKTEPGRKGGFNGSINGQEYAVTDTNAEIMHQAWASNVPEIVAGNVLKNTLLWDADLTLLPGFKDAVTQNLETILTQGTLRMLQDPQFNNLA